MDENKDESNAEDEDWYVGAMTMVMRMMQCG